MKVLYSAFDCNPLLGSDPYVGWSWISNMANINEVWVLLREDHKPYIESYMRDHHLEGYAKKNLHFVYLSSSQFFGKIVYRLNVQFAVVGQYFVWQRNAYNVAKKLHKTEKFNIVHIVSLADFRFPGYLWKLNIPCIFGPVGGAQETPKCLRTYIKKHEKNEIFRELMNRFLIKLPNYKKALRAVNIIYCSNIETENVIRQCLSKVESHKIYRLTELGINNSYLMERSQLAHNKDLSEIVRILVSGRLIYRKGLELLLDVINRMDKNLPFVVDVYGEGDQSSFLQAKTTSLGLQDKVLFHGKVSFSEMQLIYKEADVYCLPSLRETTGTAVFEAMANKLPVVALKQNGVKDIVGDDCGILVDIKDKEQIIKDFSSALIYMIENPNQRMAWGKRGYDKIIEHYTWDKRIMEMNKVYERLINNKL